MKKIITLCISIFLLLPVTSAFANDSSSFSSLNQSEINDLETAKQATEGLKTQMDKQEPLFIGDPKTAENQASTISTDMSRQAAGSYTSRAGEFLVTTDTASSSSSTWAGGHAGLVYSSNYVLESFGNKGDMNGVKLWPNDWDARYEHFQLRTVIGTTLQQDIDLALKAYNHLNKPYNYNFFNINQSSSFYCSQLVYYMFNSMYNINLNDGGAVWPVDLTQSEHAYVVYSQ
ncbi:MULTISPECIES: YiiX/YebB-like N1pC/P60 family cysteine hydrolase [Paenibacillus]|uniref:YiiX/YebB-like N1pC/P60 family cysteine hydrolase n=1 Tax=Paenibacillus TaxID=44249 RepID=UPI00168B0D06|nr:MULTISPECIES: YiiX/YebB-like N1pC/P60 family cysteine hydrolase [Paenibacillus]